VFRFKNIQEGAEKKIPIMIAANKTDLREQLKGDDRRCVSAEDGDKLAKVCAN
jgi:signal recognition particle receptor subunit beta